MTSSDTDPTAVTLTQAPTAAPSSETVAVTKSKSKKKRQQQQRTTQQLQTVITQLRQLCNQANHASYIDQANKIVNDHGLKIEPERRIENGLRIPPSVWRPQTVVQNIGAGAARPRGLPPPPKEIRLTAAERATLSKDQEQKEIRSKLRCAVTVKEFEMLLVQAQKAGMDHEVELTRKKLSQLKKQQPQRPHAAEPQTVESQTVESQTVESQTVESQTVESQTVESQTVESQTVESQTAESQTAEQLSEAGQPQTKVAEESQPTASEPKSGIAAEEAEADTAGEPESATVEVSEGAAKNPADVKPEGPEE
ncbi:hypothetical protein GNI_096860 [Gregarina niphandrodes]|uniref:Uncharacterized protein n=1 Tax=Gregarina niphandrodes TaxID=110365 RepID=A0A023B4W4_GRENI|nr:hypothetical protein GNI_096860 [Gregarina niphandrodes]EZG57832.1 hypothetical protein GNI_096860 [Gregarina niphandrodes]|eukprot:XP_011131029.1 hypothetical protein GNI_096860 [Gregarina niphandrodes]